MSLVLFSLCVLVGGVALGCAVMAARWLHMKDWQSSLLAYQLYPPANLDAGDVSAWLAGINAMTHSPSRFALLPMPPTCLEICSTVSGIEFFVLVHKSHSGSLLSGIRAAMPGARIVEADAYLARRPAWCVAGELVMTHDDRPLAVDRVDVVSTAILASLQAVVGSATEIRIQWVFTSAGTAERVPGPSVVRKTPWLVEVQGNHDSEAVQAARMKRREPQLLAVGRVGVAAPTRAMAYDLFGRVWNNFHGMNAVGVRLRRSLLPSGLIGERLARRDYPLLRWPLLLSSIEGAGLLGLPISGQPLPGLTLGVARQLPPAQQTPSRGAIIGTSNYPGMTGRPLALHTADRLRHMHLIAPTGGGKSTLMAQLALQDIEAGRGVVVIDPKNDLVEAIAARIPEDRREDVVILDPSATSGHVVGFNPLNVAGTSEHARELVADHVLGIFHSIYRDFWGPRTDDILRAALLTLTHTIAPDGSAFTLIEVPEVLTNPALRRFVSQQASLPAHLRQYWQQFDSMSEDARMNAIGSVLNKLRAFTMRTPIRLMLGQSQGIKLDEKFCRSGILLVPLSKGTLGSETANLLGSLLVVALWQATLQRVRLAPSNRPAMFAFLDEFQDVVRLGGGTHLADMLAQARGLGLGLVLAHQHLSQLPESVQQAVFGTVRSRVAFQCEYADATALAKRLAPLTADDLQGLAAYEIAAQLSIDGQTRMPVTGTTLPLAAPAIEVPALATESRQRHGSARADVEAALLSRIAVTSKTGIDGRRRRGVQP